MAQDYASSIAGAVIRLTRLKADGSLFVGPSGSYVSKQFISLSFTPEYETGDEFTTKAADGTPCVTFKAPDTLKRVTISIAICNPDPEFTEMIAGGTLLTKSGKSVGWALPEVGVDPTPNGVAIEVWSKAIINGKPAAVNPYWHWILPYTQMHQSGERVIQNDVLATNFEGWGVGNALFGSGPAAPLWEYGATTSPAAYGRTTTIPVGTGYQASAAV